MNLVDSSVGRTIGGSFSDRRSWASAFLVAIGLAGLGGACTAPTQGGGGGGLLRAEGEEWTILCVELRAPSRDSDAKQVADALRKTPGVKPDQVYTRGGEGEHRVYYGHYLRTPNRDRTDFEMPPTLRSDVAMIKNLVNTDGSRLFLHARVMPAPTPDVGNPAWEVKNNRGEYTLRVALFYNEPGFYDRKQAAAAYCEELRAKGYEAYSRHGDLQSEVLVGSFGADAMEERRQDAATVRAAGSAVRALQGRENFQYELWNMKARSAQVGGQKVMRASQVVAVHEPDEAGGERP